MADATTARLDTADLALEFGWHVEYTSNTDKFSKDGRTIVVAHTAADEITSIAIWDANGGHEVVDDEFPETVERLRTWLAGQEVPNPFANSGSKAPKLRWSRENWLHKPTQEVVDNSDPRVPRTVDAAKKQNKIWFLIGSQANVPGGYYRRDMDMNTAAAGEPMYTATWNPDNNPAVLLTLGSSGQAYWACVRHHQTVDRV